MWTYEYDEEGNRTAKVSVADSDQRFAYLWDGRNRLTEVRGYDADGFVTQVTTYAYDHLNRWVQSSTGPENGPAVVQKYVYDGDQIILMLDGSDSPVARYLWGPATDLLLAEDRLGATPQQFWPLGDHQNSVRDLVERDPQSGAADLVDHVIFSAFGEQAHDTEPAINSLFGFTGRPFDPSTGLQNNLHRWYDAALTQWLSEDPIGFAAGDANTRRYVSNDPVNKVDPSGLEERRFAREYTFDSREMLKTLGLTAHTLSELDRMGAKYGIGSWRNMLADVGIDPDNASWEKESIEVWGATRWYYAIKDHKTSRMYYAFPEAYRTYKDGHVHVDRMSDTLLSIAIPGFAWWNSRSRSKVVPLGIEETGFTIYSHFTDLENRVSMVDRAEAVNTIAGVYGVGGVTGGLAASGGFRAASSASLGRFVKPAQSAVQAGLQAGHMQALSQMSQLAKSGSHLDDLSRAFHQFDDVRAMAQSDDALRTVKDAGRIDEVATTVNPRSRLPRTQGKWIDGTPGNGVWQSEIPEVNAVTGGEPVQFLDGRPVFTPWSKGQIKFKPGQLDGTDADFDLVYEYIKDRPKNNFRKCG